MRPAIALLVILLLAGCAPEVLSGPVYPKIINGEVAHPETGKPVNCELMAPFEERMRDIVKGGPRAAEWTDAYVAATNLEIGGEQGARKGLTTFQLRQGVEMSRACRALNPALK